MINFLYTKLWKDKIILWLYRLQVKRIFNWSTLWAIHVQSCVIFWDTPCKLLNCLDQIVTCTWVDDPDNGFNDSMAWMPQELQVCTGIFRGGSRKFSKGRIFHKIWKYHKKAHEACEFFKNPSPLNYNFSPWNLGGGDIYE